MSLIILIIVILEAICTCVAVTPTIIISFLFDTPADRSPTILIYNLFSGVLLIIVILARREIVIVHFLICLFILAILFGLFYGLIHDALEFATCEGSPWLGVVSEVLLLRLMVRHLVIFLFT